MRFDSAQCKQKGAAHLFVLLVGLIVAVLFGLFWLGLVKFPQSKTPESLFKDNTLASAKLTSPQPEEKTYSNKEEFQFNYPVGFSAKEDTEEDFNKRGNGNFRKNFKGYVGYEPAEFLRAVAVLDETDSYSSNPFSLWVFNNQDNLTVEKWFAKYWYYPFLWGVFDWTSKGHVSPDSEATVSGEAAVAKVVSYQQGSPKYIYISKNQKMYLFRIIGETGDEILSSFKFLE